MTPFKKLGGSLQKHANSSPAPDVNWKGELGELGADIALGSNPFTGVPWFLGKTINSGRKGNWGDAAMNLGMGALSLVPGAGSAAAAAKGGIKGGLMASRLGRTGQVLGKGRDAYKGVVNSMSGAMNSGLKGMQKLPGIAPIASGYNKLRSAWLGNNGSKFRSGSFNLLKNTMKFSVPGLIGSALPSAGAQQPSAPGPPTRQWDPNSLTDQMARMMSNGGSM